ncbi:hypothetical protein C445_19248 [Halobiforma lacisalsi AJ5]|uniref:Uncharacterized protein n=1 Tax=Natronobacterium lacisalsi AJ5 TaxID=358396 RepID=M0L3P3_NATLA|nr:hypothetical protein C445_19248 [Halobiforma lacisalsi AJ5]
MSVHLECDQCGATHTIPDRPMRSGADTGGTGCPECGAGSYTVRRTGLGWHPSDP